MNFCKILFAITLFCLTTAIHGAENPLLANARKGDVASQLQLAGEYILGKNRNPNPALGLYWYRQAAMQNSPAGQYNLAVCLLKGWGGKKRPAEAMYFFEKAMLQGVVKAAGYYAEMLYNGVEAEAEEVNRNYPGTPPNKERALEILRLYAPKSPDIQLKLAKYLYREAAVYGKELRDLLAAHAKSPHPADEALLLYSACLRSGIGGVPDPQTGAQILQQLAEKKHPDAMAQLSELLRSGFGIKQNLKLADFWEAEAIRANSPRAFFNRGMNHLNGIYLPHDPVKAFAFFQKAAEKKFPPALRKLGDCYADGVGVEKNPKEALEYFHHAAQRGDVESQYKLGEAYRTGLGTPVNLPASSFWYTQAAHNGSIRGMRELAIALYTGRGIDKNRIQAAKWLQKAAAAGDKKAIEIIRTGIYE